jgi:hypothetical protein
MARGMAARSQRSVAPAMLKNKTAPTYFDDTNPPGSRCHQVVAYNVLKRRTQTGLAPFTCHITVNMPYPLETYHSSNLLEILRTLMATKQTGYLKVKEGEREGFVAVENGIIINAKTGPYTALHALFQFVGWREAKFDFHERPMPSDLSRDLAVYDPNVLITGIAAKVDELVTHKI